MHWLKQYWFKLGIMISFIVTAFFFIYSLQMQDQRRNAEKCQQLGKEYYLRYEQQVKDGSGTSVFNPEYHFNQRLNTCLVKIGDLYLSGEVYSKNWHVIDILSNKTILTSEYVNDDLMAGVQIDEFMKQADILLSE